MDFNRVYNHTVIQSRLIMKTTTFIQSNLLLFDYKTYVISGIFVVLAVLTPLIIHSVGGSGQAWLPLYFFILVGSYKFGSASGLVTTIGSIGTSYLLTQMPPTPILYLVVLKGLILTLFAGYMGKEQKLSLLRIVEIVLMYQVISAGIIFVLSGKVSLALMDIQMGYPGLLVQVVGGFFVLQLMRRFQY